jgi:F-box protein 21
MSLVYVFVAVARHLGIAADPANFPGIVQARVQPPNGETAKLLDMRGDDPPAEFPQTPYTQFWPAMIANQEYTRPASPATMLQRACNNISAFIQHELAHSLHNDSETYDTAIYAGACWILLEGQANHALPFPPDSKPLDHLPVLLDGMCPSLPDALQSIIATHCQRIVEDEETRAQVVKARSKFSGVKYFVGLPFLHKRYDYLGIVYGWDVSL